MFVHIGGDYVIRAREIIAIFETEIESTSPITAEFLQKARRANRVVTISNGETKSVVITEHQVYCSPISSLTLKRRTAGVYQHPELNEEKSR